MRKKAIKWFWAWDFDKEEKWLNEMAAKGFGLVSVSYCQYTFEKCNPGEYNVRIEFLDNLPSALESQQYIKFVEMTGAEHIASVFRWVYFRKKVTNGEFVLYSDNRSRINHLNRILTLFWIATIPNLGSALLNIANYQRTGALILLIGVILNSAIAIFITLGFTRIFKKRRELKNQMNLFE